jgi:hypothetical protein
MAANVTTLEGVVRDASGAIVPKAEVSCVGESTGFRFTAQTGLDGRYAMSLPEGRYDIVVRHSGFRRAAQVGVHVASKNAIHVDFEIVPENVSDSVTIREAIEPDGKSSQTDSSDTVIRPDDVHGLPRNDNTVMGLLALSPGVLYTPASRGEPGQFSSLGSRPNTNRFIVDGVSANNAVAGAGWPSFLPGERLPAMTALGTTQTLAVIDSIENVTVRAEDDGASFEQDPGAHVIVQTKQGGDQFHGALSFAGRPPALGASDWFANRYDLRPDAPSYASGAGSFGGPLQRGKTYFFFAAEHLRLNQGYAWTTTVPSPYARSYAANLQPLLNEFPLPNGRQLTLGISEYIGQSRTPAGLTSANLRLDRQVSAAERLFLRLADTPSWSETGLTQTNTTHYRGRVAALGSTWTGQRWIQDTRVSFSRNEARTTWAAAGGGVDPQPGFYSQYPSLAADFSNISVGGAGSVSFGQSGHNVQNQWQASHTASWRLAQHEAVFGLNFVDLTTARHGGETSTTVAFGTPTDVLTGPPAPVWITNSRAQTSSVHLPRASAFARDSWKINSRLSLNFGLGASWVRAPRLNAADNLYRVDASTVGASAEDFTPIQQNEPVWRGAAVRLTPTASAAWRASGVVLRASWALFQDTGSSAATDQLNGIPYQQLRSPDGLASGFLYSPAFLSTVPLGYGYSSGLQLASYQRWNVRIERDLRELGVLQAGYSGLTGTHEFRKQIFLDPSDSLGGLTFVSSAGESQYNALNAAYRRALAHGFQANVSYSWSHSIDTGSADSTLFLVSAAQNASTDRGSSDFDARHVLNAALTYMTPRRSGFASQLASDWLFGAMVTAHSGFPIDPLISETLQGFAIANYRPTLISGAPLWVTNSDLPGGRLLNPSAFGIPYGALAPIGRNTIRGFGLWQTDMSAERAFVLKGSWRIALRAEAYNIFNHPQFSDPARFASNPAFGQSQSPLNLSFGNGSPGSGESPALVTGAPRSLQFSLRVSF